MSKLSPVLLSSVLLWACGTAPPPSPLRLRVDQVLDEWHQAASDADLDRYMSYFAPNAVFIGTDATERWTLEEFRDYASARFMQGQGWTYDGQDRFVVFGPSGDVAWIDERLKNEKYGELRGTGVLVRFQGQWKIAHYSMSFPIPNEIAPDVVKRIEEALGKR